MLQSGNASFEPPVIPQGTYQAWTGAGGWTTSGEVGLSTSAAATGAGLDGAPDGVQYAYLGNGGTLTQMVSLTPGTYVVSFKAHDHPAFPNVLLSVKLNGAQITNVDPGAGNSFNPFTSGTFTVATSGNYQFDFTAGATPTGFVYLDDVRILSVGAFQNPSFEAPMMVPGTYGSLSPGNGWITTGNSGISTAKAAVGAGFPPAPLYGQYAYYDNSGTFAQSVYLGNSAYVLTFRAMAHPSYPGSIRVTRGGILVGDVTPPAGTWGSFSLGVSNGGAGTYQFSFGVVNPNVGQVLYIDDITITAAP